MAELNTITSKHHSGKDAAYVLVGLGVLGAQRVAVSGRSSARASRPATSTSAWPSSVRRSPATTPRSSSWPRKWTTDRGRLRAPRDDHEAGRGPAARPRTRVRHQGRSQARDLRSRARPVNTVTTSSRPTRPAGPRPQEGSRQVTKNAQAAPEPARDEGSPGTPVGPFVASGRRAPSTPQLNSAQAQDAGSWPGQRASSAQPVGEDVGNRVVEADGRLPTRRSLQAPWVAAQHLGGRRGAPGPGRSRG